MQTCGACSNVGVLIAVHKISNAQFGFRCDCIIGRAKYCVAIPLWSARYAEQYKISPIYVPTVSDEEEEKEEIKEEDFDLF